ncbi:pectin lyase fold/virulence factor [Aspergillus spectabilis]
MRLSYHRFASALLCLTSLGNASPIADALSKRAGIAIPPSGCLIVGSGGQYGTITQAINALGLSTSAACILIYPGTYTVAADVSIKYRGPLTLYGATPDITKQSANQAYNINFRNTYGTQGQAVAVTANGDKQGYYACGFYVLFQLHIEGAVDFICGSAAAWFGECTIASNGGGYLTASSRSTTADGIWYVFDHSTIRAAAGKDLAGKVFLGRPWRVLVRVIYQNSVFEFREFQNNGAGSDTSRRKWLTSPTNAGVSKNQLWGNDWGTWVDRTW